MKRTGKIIKWNDEKGFGFIESGAQGTEYFFHISSFKPKSHRPELGLEVSFKQSVDHQGRNQATKVYSINTKEAMGPSKKTFIASFLFLLVVSVATFLDYLPKIILYLYLIISAVTFLFYAWDKSSAKRSRSRIAEATLHNLSLFGGWPGALLAQQILRHKSVKKSFRIKFWITVFLNLASLVYLISPYGNWLLKKISELTSLS
jgi:uncharacterized membrane protein YsdA (DUF1294 family)/cold shock CspA family protein